MTTQTIVREFEAELVVTESVVVADDVVALTLTAPDGSALPPWTPGAHVDLVLGEYFVGSFLAYKRNEVERFERFVTDWEFREYAYHL